MPKRYNHAFDIAFSLETDHDGEHVTARKILSGLARRIADLIKDGDDAVREAVGLPFDTYENEPDEADDAPEPTHLCRQPERALKMPLL